MAFNSLNTIDKDCVTVANGGGKKSGCTFPGGRQPRWCQAASAPGSESWKMRGSLGTGSSRASLTFIVTSQYLYNLVFSFFPLFLVMNVGVPPAYREKCALCFPGIFLTRYSSFVYQPRTILVVFLLLNLTVSLVNTGRWIIVSKKKKKTAKARLCSRNTLLDNLSCITNLFFSCVLPSFCCFFFKKKKRKRV